MTAQDAERVARWWRRFRRQSKTAPRYFIRTCAVCGSEDGIHAAWELAELNDGEEGA